MLVGQSLQLLVSGKETSLAVRPPPDPMWHKATFYGDIDEIRVSSVVRYPKDFTPKPRFETDADTIALYHFDEGKGDVVNDASGHNRHAKISGVKWVATGPDLGTKTITNSIGMKLAFIPKGTFQMGGGGGKVGDKEVEIAHDFYLGVYQVTQGEWEKVMGNNPSHFSRTGAGKDLVKDIPDEDLKRFPVEMVSWNDAQLFLEELNKREIEPGWVYRLPKEAEREYACRGGPASTKLEYGFDFYFEKPTNQLLPDQANFDHVKGLKRTCKVGSYKPNRLGLHDMHGNVWEWCEDAQNNADEGARVIRGGRWDAPATGCRAAAPGWGGPAARYNAIGLRVARVPVSK